MTYGKKYEAGDENNGWKYILWCPTSTEVPSYVFPDRPSAIKASYVMAKKFSGQTFFICKIVGKTVVSETKFTDLDK